MVQTALIRAQKYNIPCSITPDDFEIPEFCPILGIKLVQGTRTFIDASPSLDRIIPELGYVPGNVAVMSFRANRFKSNALPNELRKVADWMDAWQLANLTTSPTDCPAT